MIRDSTMPTVRILCHGKRFLYAAHESNERAEGRGEKKRRNLSYTIGPGKRSKREQRKYLISLVHVGR